MNEHENTAGLLIGFSILRERDAFRSDAEGREIINEVEIISIRMRGSMDEIVRLVTDEDRNRFLPIYRAWKERQAAPISGTPLDDWPGITRSLCEELAGKGFRSVEQLAEMPDEIAGLNPQWASQKARAQGWIAASAGSSVHSDVLTKLIDALPKTKANANILKGFGIVAEEDELAA